MASQQEKRKQVAVLLRAGVKAVEAARNVGVSERTAYNVRARMEDGDNLETKSGCGRKPKLKFVASNGKVAPLIWFKTGYRLNGSDYVDILKKKFLPWVRKNFPDDNVVLQQDGAPAHTCKKVQEFLAANIKFWPKEMWPPYSPDANPLDFSFWPPVQSKACRVRHASTDALKRSVNKEWKAMSAEYVSNTCRSFRKRLEAIVAAEGGYIE